MNLSYKTNEDGYIAYLENFSKVTSFGKSARKRFYIGFSFVYLLIWIAVFYYVLVNGQTPVPYFIMSLVIYVVLNVYMRYVDIHKIGAKRRAIKDIYNKTIELDQQIDISIEDDHTEVTDKTGTTRYKNKNIWGVSYMENFVVLYIQENKAFVIPKNILSETNIKTLLVLFNELEN